jgi:hypothetical protein
MVLTMREKQAITRELAGRYRQADKKARGAILDQVADITGYNRCYATLLLRNWGRQVALPTVAGAGPPTLVVGDQTETSKRVRPRVYDDKVVAALKQVWLIAGGICGKRLAPFLAELVPILERHEEVVLDEGTRTKLLAISAASIDRVLAETKAAYRLKERGGPRPSSSLLHRIPIQTHSEATADRPGFVEIDLVGHDGGSTSGEYVQTLDVTDRYSGWTETQAVRNKAQEWVFAALKDIRRRLPFPLLGIHSDGGSEFINQPLFDYCEAAGIEFTRSRSYNKNDNCHVEQKNFSVVRQAVGYFRYETERHLVLLNRLYAVLRPYTNYFQPMFKLLEKTRVGSSIRKRYDQAKTPYQRLCAWDGWTEEARARASASYEQLNPAALRRQSVRLEGQLLKAVEGEAGPLPKPAAGQTVSFV